MQRPELEGTQLQSVRPGDVPVWWINVAILPEGVSAEEVGMRLIEDCPDVEIRPGFFPCDQMEIFKGDTVVHCPNADLLYRRLVALPSSTQLTEAGVQRVCDALAATL